jgi:hypothetical protein
MAKDPDFMAICGLKSQDIRMRDIEEADDKRNISDRELYEIKAAFKNSCQIIRSMFGEHAFKRYYRGKDGAPDGNWEPKKFNASLYDILMYSFAIHDKNTVYQNLDAIREALIHLMTNDEQFIDSILLSTSSVQAVRIRFSRWQSTLMNILATHKKEPRCFSLELKRELFDRNATCAICGQHIHSLDDSAIDHVKQYWMGGRTIPENARLTHRFCNWARARNDTA